MIDTAKQQMPMTADDVLRMSIEGPREGNGNGVDSETRIVAGLHSPVDVVGGRQAAAGGSMPSSRAPTPLRVA